MMPEALMDYFMNGRGRGMMENRDDFIAPHGCYRCQGEDEWAALAATNEDEWQALCQVMGHEEWAKDERFADIIARHRNQDALDALINDWTRERDKYQVMHLLQRAGVPAGVSSNAEDVLADPHLKERGWLLEIDHPVAGLKTYGGPPAWLKGMPPRLEPSPLLGQHNDYVLGELLGMSQEEIKSLMERQVVY